MLKNNNNNNNALTDEIKTLHLIIFQISITTLPSPKKPYSEFSENSENNTGLNLNLEIIVSSFLFLPILPNHIVYLNAIKLSTRSIFLLFFFFHLLLNHTLVIFNIYACISLLCEVLLWVPFANFFPFSSSWVGTHHLYPIYSIIFVIFQSRCMLFCQYVPSVNPIFLLAYTLRKKKKSIKAVTRAGTFFKV